MKKFMLYLTFALFMLMIVNLIVFALFLPEYFGELKAIVLENIWPLITFGLTFLGFVTAGVLINRPKSLKAFFEDTLVQIAVIVLFICMLLLTLALIFYNQNSTLYVKLESRSTTSINAILIRQGDKLIQENITRNVSIPDTLSVKRGVYIIKINEEGYDTTSKTVEVGLWKTVSVTVKDQVKIKMVHVRAPESAPDGLRIQVTFTTNAGVISKAQHKLPFDTTFTKEGQLTVKLISTGYRQSSVTEGVKLNQEVNIEIKAELLPPENIKVSFKPVSPLTQWSVKDRALAPGDGSVWLSEGKHEVTFKKSNGEVEKYELIVKKDNSRNHPLCLIEM